MDDSDVVFTRYVVCCYILFINSLLNMSKNGAEI